MFTFLELLCYVKPLPLYAKADIMGRLLLASGYFGLAALF